MARNLLVHPCTNPIGGFAPDRTWHLQHSNQILGDSSAVFAATMRRFRMPGGKSLPVPKLATYLNRYRRYQCY